MAIWPFGRKSKRHTIQLGEPHPPPAAAHQPDDHHHHDAHPQQAQPPQPLPDSMPLEPRLTRKKSKRQKNRHSQPVLHPPSSSFHDVAATRSASSSHPPPRTALSEQQHTNQQHQPPPRLLKQRHPRFDDVYASSRVAPHPPSAMSRSASVKGNNNSNNNNNNTTANNGHAVLKKRLSQRKMNKIAREQEIRLMTSSPIDIPRRHGQPDHLNVAAPVKRGPTRSRRAERHRSDTSLSNRDSASSLSEDFSGTNTFKVNALAAFTPRPLIRYVDPPRPPASRSQNASAASTRRERLPALTVSEENLSKRRIDRLADDLDAGALRELLERDRRRQELKNIRDNERAQRKLERSAERQRRAEPAAEAEPAPEASEQQPLPRTDEEEAPRETQPGSWLRDVSSREPPHSNRQSVESTNVIGNIDDSSIREPPSLAQRPSFARSQDLGMSRTTLSPAQSQSQSQSPSRHGVASPTSSLIYGMARESLSDASPTVDSERRMSDHSGQRMNTFSSLFRRGSSRLKRSYRQRFQDTSDLSSASHPSAHHLSHESFAKVPTQSSAPTSSVPPRPFNRSTGTVKRAQSKFTEHFGDEPLSPPDSRLQSPDITEEPSTARRGIPIPIPIGTAYPIPGSDPDLPAAAFRNRPQRSWIADPTENAETQNLPLSRSLASIDSEGSWMSGHFLRRISQRGSSQHPVRHSTGQFDQGPDDDVSAGLEQTFIRFSPNNEEEERTSGDVPEPTPVPEPASSTRPDVPRLADEDPAETWHTEVGKRPVLVNPTVRPKSTEGLLKNVQTLSPLSADEEFGPIEEHAAELDYATDEDN